jgi:hypothetical protein
MTLFTLTITIPFAQSQVLLSSSPDSTKKIILLGINIPESLNHFIFFPHFILLFLYYSTILLNVKSKEKKDSSPKKKIKKEKVFLLIRKRKEAKEKELTSL